jgi:hypothetical protein
MPSSANIRYVACSCLPYSGAAPPSPKCHSQDSSRPAPSVTGYVPTAIILGKIWERTQNLKMPAKSHRIKGPLALIRAHNSSGRGLPAAISLAVTPILLSEFLHSPVNDELGLRIGLFRLLFDWFGHVKTLSRTYTELLALLANECGCSRS